MMPSLVVAAVVTGCAPPAHVALEIETASDVLRVDLFIAPHRCNDDERVTTECDAELGWDTAPRKLAGDTFILDVSAITVADRTGDGEFRIDLAPDPDRPRDTIDRLLLVGYADTGGTQPIAATMLESLELPRGVERWRIELGDVEAIPADPDTRPATDKQRLHLWGTEAQRCIVMERWVDAGTKVRRDFLLPHEDTDCDAAIVECDPFWFEAPPMSRTPSEATCAAPHRLPGDVRPTCQLGALSCSETSASGSACTPVSPTHCLADALCDPSCVPDAKNCFQTLALAHIHCDIVTDAEGSPCQNSTPSFLALSRLAASPLADCGLPLFGPITMPFPGFANPGTIGPITLTASDNANMSAVCSADIEWSGTVTADSISFGLAKVPLPNGTSSVVGVIVDVHHNACTLLAPACYLVMNDGDSASHCGPYVPP